jgi:hypothetical protein
MFIIFSLCAGLNKELNEVLFLLGQGVDMYLIFLSFSGYTWESRTSLHLENFQR